MTVQVVQDGLRCAVSPTSAVVGVDGGGTYVDVTTEGNGAWTATANDSWLTVVQGASGTGDGNVLVVADPMTDTQSSRTGSVTIGSKTVYITQRGYELAIAPPVAEIGSNAGQGEFGVSASLTDVWNLIVTEPWITIIGSKTGTGSGTVRYSVGENTTGSSRTGKIIVAGEEYTVNQLAMPLVTTSVEGHGSVSGAGGYAKGTSAVLRANPDSGYAFSHWSGDVDGTENPITIQVDDAVSAVAHFVPLPVSGLRATTADAEKVDLSWDALDWANTYRIYRSTTTTRPESPLGTVPASTRTYSDSTGTAGQSYYYWVEAQSLDSSSFAGPVSGMRGGTPVTPPTPHTPPAWSPVTKEDTLIVYATVYDRSAAQFVESSGSLLAAFDVNGVCRGVAEVEDGPMGKVFQLSVGIESATESGFLLKVWNAQTGETADLAGTIASNAEKVLGTIVAPIQYDIGVAEMSVSLAQGWNWISTYLVPEDGSVNSVLGGGTFADNDVVKSSSRTATYYGGKWYPSTFAIEAGKTYMVQKSAGGDETIAIAGTPMDDGIPLDAGWNWFASTVATTSTVSMLTHTGDFANNDIVKSSSRSATYYGAWYSGTFEILPGAGYKAKVANPGTLYFGPAPVARVTKKAVSMARSASSGTVARPNWQGVTKEDTLVLYAIVKDAKTGMAYESEGSMLAAFDAEGECRGCALIEEGPLGKLFQLSIGVESATETGFKLQLWDAASEEVLEVEGNVDSNVDKQLGWIFSPIEFCIKTTGAEPVESAIDYTNLKGATHANPSAYTEGTSVTFTAPSAVTGYTFAGWTPSSITADMTGALTVTANWTANTYTIAYNANGGSGTMTGTAATYDQDVALAANGFTRTGFEFAGWALEKTARPESAPYHAGDTVRNLSVLQGGVVTLYAVWEVSAFVDEETQTTEVPVPYAWLRAKFPGVGNSAGDMETKAHAIAANGRKVWECYVAGENPTDPLSRFKGVVTLADGKVLVSWTPDLNTNGVARIYTVYGCTGLGKGVWETPIKPWHRFFKVTVAMPTGADGEETAVPGEGFVPEEKPLGGVQLWEDGPYWAECNVGASKPEESGYYFWWGDTVGYVPEGGPSRDDFSYNVTWVSSTGTRMDVSPFETNAGPTRAMSESELRAAGYIDATGNLVAKYDAATAHLGAPWRMPTKRELDDLVNNCNWTYTARNGVEGQLVTGRGTFSTKSIFLPIAGEGCGGDLVGFGGWYGNYWSSTLYGGNELTSWGLHFSWDYFGVYNNNEDRCDGHSVRPLRGFAK